MANNSERMIFGIGFDLATGVDEVIKQWEGKESKRLQKILDKKPLKVSLEIKKGILTELKDFVKVTREVSAAQKSINAAKRQEIEIASKAATLKAREANARNANVRAQINEATKQDQINKKKNDAAYSEIRLTNAKNNGVRATNAQNRAYQTQGSYLSRIIRRMAVYASVAQVISFVKNIREVTAEFELQRVALGSLIGDMNEANKLFEQIKVAALKSPFEIKDLVTYTKQLAAYKIEQDELFETTQRLADVSAGLGVGMDRLILAYGQIRATGYLRASEVRQLTEAGVPIVEELAKKMSQLRGETVSAAEVMALISERAISFGQVKEVFEDMTNEGGMFYKMQEKQSQTLAGQWSNMKDTLSIMFDEMGRSETMQKVFGTLISLTKSLAKNWRVVSSILMGIGAGWASSKILPIFGKLYKYSDLTSRKTHKLGQIETARRRAEQFAAEGRKIDQEYELSRVKSLELEYEKLNRASNMSAVKRWKNSFKGFIGQNWLSVLITLAVSLISWLIQLGETSKSVKTMIREFINDTTSETNDAIDKFNELADAVVNAADGSLEQSKALKEIQDTYQDVIPIEDLQIDKLRGMAGAYDELTDAIIRNNYETKRQEIADQVSRQFDVAGTQEELIEELKDIGLESSEVNEIIAKIKDDIKKGKIIPEDIEGIINYMSEAIGYELQYSEEWINMMKRLQKNSDIGEILTPKFEMSELFHGPFVRTMDYITSKSDRYFFNDWYDFIQTLYTMYAQMREAQGLLNEEFKLEFNINTEEIDRLNKIVNDHKAALDEISKNAKDAQTEMELTAEQYKKAFLEIFKINEEKLKKDYPSIESFIDAVESGEKELANDFADSIRKYKWKSKPAKRAVEKILMPFQGYGNWRDEFAAATKFFKGNKLYAFTEDEIQKFTSLNDALSQVASKYNELGEEILAYQNAINNGDLSEKEKQSAEETLEKRKEEQSLYASLLDTFNAWDKVKKDSGSSKTDPRIAELQKELSTLEKMNKMYKELLNVMSSTEAKAKIDHIFKDFQPKYLEKAWSDSAIRAQYTKAIKTLKTFWGKEKDKAIFDLEIKLGELQIDDTIQNIEEDLKKASEELSRTKVAKDFFNKILGITNDKELSASLTISVYGTAGEDLKDKLIQQVEGAFKNYDLSSAINQDLKSIDVSALRKIYESVKDDEGNEEQKKAMKETIDYLEKEQGSIADAYAKLLLDYDEMEQKRVNITKKTTQEIATLEDGLALEIAGINDKKITEEEKEDAINSAKARADAARNAILAREKFELNKLSPDYIRFFTSINSMAESTANTTRTELRQALFDAFAQGAISAEELRKELKAIDTQFNKLNENANLFSSYFTGGLDGMFTKLRQNADELDAIASRMMELKSLDEMDEGDKNFVNRMLNVFGNEGQKSLTDLAKSFNNDMNGMGNAVQGVGGKMQGMFSGAQGALAIVDMIIKSVSQSIEAVGQVIDQINSMRSEDNQVGGWFNYVRDFNKYATSGWENLKSGNIAGALADTAGSIISIFQNIQSNRIKRLNEEIERQEELLEKLEYSYGRLEKAQEKTFGSDYISSYDQKMANLRAQQEAYLKQAELERAKGKKADSDKIKDYEEQARDTADKIKDMQSELSEYFLGTDLTSAARDFANAWIDAYKEFGSTTDAMKEKFQDMIQNMIVESFAAKVIQSALSDIFTEIDNMTKDGVLDMSEASKIADMTEVAVGNIDVGMTNLMNSLSQAGISVRGMGSELTGISRDIATASEESILGLAAGINTQNFYISQVPTKLDTIIGLLRGENAMQGSAITLQDLVTIQNQHLSHLPSIAQHTADTVAECKQIVAETRRTADALERVIKPRGTQATHTVNTSVSYN